MQRTLQFARVFNSHKTVALRISFCINMAITRFTIYANSISKYDIYTEYTKYFALVSHRTRICIYDKILESASSGSRTERDREREGEQEKVRKNLYCLS